MFNYFGTGALYEVGPNSQSVALCNFFLYAIYLDLCDVIFVVVAWLTLLAPDTHSVISSYLPTVSMLNL